MAEDLRTPRPARGPGPASAASHIFRTSLLTGLALLAFALPALADGSPFDDRLPPGLRSVESFEPRPPSISFRRNQSRAVEAPTRYPETSLLKYSTPIGKTGLIFRVKAGPNPRRIVKLEIRF